MISSTFTICFLTALSSVAALGPAAVNLRTAANYAILAKSGISTVPLSVITGNIGVSPVSATGLTGFSPTLDSTGQFSTSAQVVGHLFAASYAAPTPATLIAATADMGTALADANGRVNPGFTNVASGAIGGQTLTPGLYKWTTGVTIGSGVTIIGTPLDTWIFQVAGALTVATGQKVTLVGALASNIVWVVGGTVSVGAGAHLEGVVLGQTSISLLSGASANGRLLAQTNVILQQATVNN
ncbi:antifreeze protein [Mycena pura]|uniref:Antifreeze protein n=1 Tax=Mycena pura TaxID=153505 RepID=A0AAD6VQP2_9AGAR|nr:antifreeze protein [Mycena pura]